MTKAELIERYGEEAYRRQLAHQRERYRTDSEFREKQKAFTRVHGKERYNNDPKFRKKHKTVTNLYHKESYCISGLDQIENYDLAKADNFKGWHIHHRLELHPDYSTRFTMESLIKLDLYYNRPASELIWVTSSEHYKMHEVGREHEDRKE